MNHLLLFCLHASLPSCIDEAFLVVKRIKKNRSDLYHSRESQQKQDKTIDRVDIIPYNKSKE